MIVTSYLFSSLLTILSRSYSCVSKANTWRKKSETFSHQEIQKVLPHLQEIISPKNVLNGMAFSMLYFWSASEVRVIEVNDVTL